MHTCTRIHTTNKKKNDNLIQYLNNIVIVNNIVKIVVKLVYINLEYYELAACLMFGQTCLLAMANLISLTICICGNIERCDLQINTTFDTDKKGTINIAS